MSLVVMLTVAAVLCVGVVAGTSARAAQQTTVSVIWSPNERASFEIMKNNFERVYPNIKVEVEYPGLGSTGFGPLLRSMLLAGTAPDVFYTVPGGSALHSVQALGSEGYLEPLTDRKWVERVPKDLLPMVTVNRKVYGLPAQGSPFVVGYNRGAFVQLGLKTPKTFKELLSLCRKISAAGKVPFVLANAYNSPFLQQAVRTGAADGGWADQRAKKKVTFAKSPKWRRALQSFVDMKNAGCYQPHPEGTTAPQSFAMFASGQGLMTTANPALINQVKAINPNLNVAGFAMPSDRREDTRLFVPTTTAVAINKASKVKWAARTLIDFFARPGQLSGYAKAGNAVSPIDATKGLFPSWVIYGRGYAKRGKLAQDPSWQFPTGLLETVINPGVQGLFTGQKTVSDILADLDREYDRLRAQK